MFMEEQSLQETSAESAENHYDAPTREEPPVKPSTDGGTGTQKGLGWGVWILILLVVFLLVSSVANLVVSQRAYESSRKQVKAIEQLTQSIKDMQGSIANLSNMIEQSPQEDEEPEEDRGPIGDGSI